MVASNPNPVSEKKLRANRRNARKSTGPKTAEGKAKSSQNAVSHGIFCQAAVLGGESLTEFQILRNAYLQTLKPQNILELSFVDRIVLSQWRLDRSQRTEMLMHGCLADRTRKYAKKSITRMQSKYEIQTAAEMEAICEENNLADQVILERFKGMFAVADLHETPACATLAIALNAPPSSDQAGIVRLSLYEQRLEGTIHRSLRQLQRLRGNTDPREWNDLPESPFLHEIKPPLQDEDIDILKASIEELQNEPTEEEEDASDDAAEVCNAPPSPRSRGERRGEGRAAPESPHASDESQDRPDDHGDPNATNPSP